MSYVLVKGADQLTLIDNSTITKGARSRGMTITYKTKKGVSSGKFIDMGTFTEMNGKKKEMEEEMNGKKKRGRKRKELTVGVSLFTHAQTTVLVSFNKDNYITSIPTVKRVIILSVYRTSSQWRNDGRR